MGSDPSLAIECQGLSRSYTHEGRGRQRVTTVALCNLNLAVPRGTVLGLLGPNGAGKTTTVRILSTLLTPTEGRATVLGYDVVRQAQAVRSHIGFVFGGDRGLYGRLTGLENLLYFGALQHLHPDLTRTHAANLLTELGLSGHEHTRVDRYSRGMKQRLHIARALLAEPDLMFMDEPTIGIDPVGAQELRTLIPELARKGKTILLTTHYMFEADAVCDMIAIINKGRLVASGTPADIKKRLSPINVAEALIKHSGRDTLDLIRALPTVNRLDTSNEGPLLKLIIHLAAGASIDGDLRAIVGAEDLQSLTYRPPTLEDAYIHLLGEHA